MNLRNSCLIRRSHKELSLEVGSTFGRAEKSYAAQYRMSSRVAIPAVDILSFRTLALEQITMKRSCCIYGYVGISTY